MLGCGSSNRRLLSHKGKAVERVRLVPSHTRISPWMFHSSSHWKFWGAKWEITWYYQHQVFKEHESAPFPAKNHDWLKNADTLNENDFGVLFVFWVSLYDSHFQAFLCNWRAGKVIFLWKLRFSCSMAPGKTANIGRLRIKSWVLAIPIFFSLSLSLFLFASFLHSQPCLEEVLFLGEKRIHSP